MRRFSLTPSNYCLRLWKPRGRVLRLPSPWLLWRAELGRAWSPVAAEAKPAACARSLECAAASTAAVYLRYGRGFLHWWTRQLIRHATEDNHTAKRLPPHAVQDPESFSQAGGERDRHKHSLWLHFTIRAHLLTLVNYSWTNYEKYLKAFLILKSKVASVNII